MSTLKNKLKPLHGITVVDFTHVLTGPACSYYLALLGAEVIKVERPKVGDRMRHRGGNDNEKSTKAMSTAYLTQAGGKRSIAVDLNSNEGRSVMNELLNRADIFVENHRPSTMVRLGLQYENVNKINPRIIHCAMTGYGRGGPKFDAPAYDVNIQAACGLMMLTGKEGSGPIRTGAPVMDYGTAMAAGFAITAALYKREQTGYGEFIDVSMLEVGLSLMSSTVTDYLITGREPKADGNAANSRSPGAGCFETKEGILSLGINEDHQFWALADLLGYSCWREDIRFVDRKTRKQYEQDLNNLILKALSKYTAQEWEDLMLPSGVPASKVRTLPESLAEAQVQERNFIHSYDDGHGKISVPTLPFRIGPVISHSPTNRPPQRGEQSIEILKELGYSEIAIRKLVALGVVEVTS